MIKRIAMLAVAALLLASSPSPAGARAAGPVTMSVTVGYGGKYVVGGFAPVTVTVKNDGPEIAGTLELLTGPDFSLRVQRSVVLPQGSEKRFKLIVSAGTLMKASDFEVVLRRNGAAVASAAPASVSAVDPDKPLCGMLSPDAASIGYMRKIVFGQTSVRDWVELTADTFPEDAALLASFGVVAAAGFDPSGLTGRQHDALRQWLSGGGVLLLGTGPASESEALLWRDLLSGLTVSGSAEAADLGELSALAQDRPFAGSLPVLRIGRGDGWEVKAEAPGLPLVLKRSVGRGSLFLAAYDLGDGAVGAWQGNGLMWQPLLNEAMAVAADGMGAYRSYTNGLYTSMNSAQGVGSSTFWVFVLLLVAFTALSGFGAFLLLRALRRQKWMWVAVPVLSALFSALLLVSGRVSFGRLPALFACSWTDATGGVARTERMLAFSVPVMGNYRLAVEGAGLLFPGETDPYRDYYSMQEPVKRAVSAVVHADSLELEFLNVNLSGTRVAGYVDFTAEAPLAATCAYDGTDVVCRLRNATGHPLTDAVVIIGKNYIKAGDIEAGGEAEVRLKLDHTPLQQSAWEIVSQLYPYTYNTLNIFGGQDRTRAARRAMLNERLDGLVGYVSETTASLGPAVCFGWLEKPFEDVVTVNGRQVQPQSMELVTAIVPVAVSGGDGQLEIVRTAGVVNTSLTKSQSAFSKGVGTLILEPGNAAVLDFDLSGAASLAVSGLYLEPGVMHYASPGTWELYDWRTETWVPADVEEGYAGDEAAAYINADGMVRARVETGNNDFMECSPFVWVQGVRK